jgi:hypothetical protein
LVVLVPWPAVIAQYKRTSNPQPRGSAPRARGLSASGETFSFSANETFDKINEIMYKWIIMSRGKMAFVLPNFEKHREIKPGLRKMS